MRLTGRLEPVNQAAIVTITVPLIDRQFSYRTDLTSARLAANRWTRSGFSPGKEATITIAGRQIALIADETGTFTFVWDGRDAGGRRIGTAEAVIRVKRKTYRARIGRWDPIGLGLGGLMLDVYDHLEANERRLYLGLGRVQGGIGIGLEGGDYLVSRSGGRFVSRFDQAGRLLTVTERSQNAITLDFVHGDEGLGEVRIRTRPELLIERRDEHISIKRGRRVLTANLDEEGRVISLRDPSDRGVSFGYSSTGLLTRVVDASGFTRTYDYDDDGRIVGFTAPGTGHSDLVRAETEHGHRVTVISPEGRESSYQVERFPDGTKVRTTRCCGDGVTVTRIKDHRTDVTHPDGTRVVSERASSQRRMLLPSGLVHDRRTQSHQTTRDGVTSISPEGRSVTVRDTNDGMLVSGSDTASMEYRVNDNGRMTSIRYGSRERGFDYDEDGLVTTIHDADGEAIRFDHDQSGWLVAQHFKDGHIIGLGRDGGGLVTSIQPPERDPTRFQYAAFGALSSIVFPDGDQIEYVRDRDLFVTERRVTGRPAILYTRGSRGEVTEVGGSDWLARFQHEHGRIVAAEASSGTVHRYTYDGPLLTSINVSGPVKGRVDYEHGPDLRLLRMTAGALSIPFEHDRDGLISAIGPAKVERDGAGRVIKTTAGVVQHTYVFNHDGQVAGMTVEVSGAPVWEVAYTYDGLGRIATIADSDIADTVRFRYDPVGRLVSVDGGETFEATYDANGAKLSVQRGDRTMQATSDPADRLTRLGSSTVDYGPGGTVVRVRSDDRTTDFEWDELGRLVSVDGSYSSSQYLRDCHGFLAGITLPDGSKHGFICGASGQPTAITSEDGETLALFGGLTSSLPPLIAVEPERTLFVASDHLGSARLVIDISTGDIIDRRRYDVWGNRRVRDGNSIVPFGFAGGIDDPVQELVHFPMRTYDPGLMSWLSRDPLQFLGGSPNLYSYADNDPVNHRDPTGAKVEICRLEVGDWRLKAFGGGIGPTPQHWWLKTDDLEAGMGYDPDAGGFPPIGFVEDHKGISNRPDVVCDTVRNVDEECVNYHLETPYRLSNGKMYGMELGRYWWDNNCQDFVDEVLRGCSYSYYHEYQVETMDPDRYDHYYSPDNVQTSPPSFDPENDPEPGSTEGPNMSGDPDHTPPDPNAYTPAPPDDYTQHPPPEPNLSGDPDHTPPRKGSLWD